MEAALVHKREGFHVDVRGVTFIIPFPAVVLLLANIVLGLLAYIAFSALPPSAAWARVSLIYVCRCGSTGKPNNRVLGLVLLVFLFMTLSVIDDVS